MHVRMVLETLRHHKLYAKASKCQFGRSSVGFLGHVISERGVAVDPRKVAAVAEWATPTSCTDVRRFVGLANYYRKFVLRFSALAAPLTALCSPRAHWPVPWGPTEQQSFDALQAALTSAPALCASDPARPTRLLVDNMELAVSAILETRVRFTLSPSSRASRPGWPRLACWSCSRRSLRSKRCGRTCSTSPSSCTRAARAYSGCSPGAAASDTPPAAASPSRRVFARRNGLPYRLSPRGDRLCRQCVPGALQTQMLH